MTHHTTTIQLRQKTTTVEAHVKNQLSSLLDRIDASNGRYYFKRTPDEGVFKVIGPWGSLGVLNLENPCLETAHGIVDAMDV